MSDPSTLDFVTLGIAAVGAVTGIAALGATWAQFWLAGPRLRLTGSTAIGFDEVGRFFLSVGVHNRGRTAASVHGISLQLADGQQHIPLSPLMTQGHARGPSFPVRLEPFTEETWLVAVEPLVRDMTADGKSTLVRPMTMLHGKEIVGKKRIDLAVIADLNQR